MSLWFLLDRTIYLTKLFWLDDSWKISTPFIVIYIGTKQYSYVGWTGPIYFTLLSWRRVAGVILKIMWFVTHVRVEVAKNINTPPRLPFSFWYYTFYMLKIMSKIVLFIIVAHQHSQEWVMKGSHFHKKLLKLHWKNNTRPRNDTRSGHGQWQFIGDSSTR